MPTDTHSVAQTCTQGIHEYANEVISAAKQKGRYRSRRKLDSPQGTEIQCDGRRMINFCSNDYLGLANHPEIIAALKQGG